MTIKIKHQPTISEVLEEARKEQGISQRVAAARLGTTPGTYRQWLRGQVPGLDRVPSFIEFTGRVKLDIVMAIVEADDRLERSKGVLLDSISRGGSPLAMAS